MRSALLALFASTAASSSIRPWPSMAEAIPGNVPLAGASAQKNSRADKPSVAILPFANMSNDPDQEFFSDGITEDIITDLSKVSGLFVLGRNTVFTYKGQAVKLERIAKELGVAYVVEGSVRKAGNRVRINAQLIEGSTGGHLWADRKRRREAKPAPAQALRRTHPPFPSCTKAHRQNRHAAISQRKQIAKQIQPEPDRGQSCITFPGHSCAKAGKPKSGRVIPVDSPLLQRSRPPHRDWPPGDARKQRLSGPSGTPPAPRALAR